MYAQLPRLPPNGHVNFICFLRAHKSKKIVFIQKICALPLSMAGHFIFYAVGDPFLQAFQTKKEPLQSLEILAEFQTIHSCSIRLGGIIHLQATIKCSRWESNQYS